MDFHRVFIAVTPPPEARQAFAAYAAKAAAAYPGIRANDSPHITLIFLGFKNDEQVAAVRASLATINAPKFTASLEGTGFFPDSRFPRVFWLGVKSPGLEELRRTVATALSLPEEKFVPHATIARIRDVRQAQALKDSAQENPFQPVSFEITSFSLFESFLEKEGARHEELAEYSLH